MKVIISKELLSEVLNREVVCNGVLIALEVSYNWTEHPMGDEDSYIDGFINIYELQHLCKEWANNKDYDLNSNTYSALESGMCGSVTFKEYEEYLTTIKG